MIADEVFGAVPLVINVIFKRSYLAGIVKFVLMKG